MGRSLSAHSTCCSRQMSRRVVSTFSWSSTSPMAPTSRVTLYSVRLVTRVRPYRSVMLPRAALTVLVVTTVFTSADSRSSRPLAMVAIYSRIRKTSDRNRTPEAMTRRRI